MSWRKRALGIGGVVLAVAGGYRRKRSAEDIHEPPSITRTPLAELAVQDWILLAYLAVLWLAVVHGDGPRRGVALAWTTGDLVVVGAGLLIARGSSLREVPRALVYRFTLLFGILGSFLQLQWILPAGSGRSLDAELYAIDLAVFGAEPAELFDRITTPATTEWFSLFYFAYFPLIGAHVLLFMFRARRRHLLAEFSFGIVWLFCVAHVVYLAVPGHGPHALLGGQFVHRLEGETFWPLVRATCNSVESSARTDIFPSLHTAGPTFLAAFAHAHRRERPFRWLYLPLVFVASQIMLATMFLRWHYLLDVCAGLMHGILAARFARAVSGWERRSRLASGARPVWTTPW